MTAGATVRRMPVVPAHGDPPPEKALHAAAAALRRGELVSLPTDTVYGIAAVAADPAAVARLFAAKRRPEGTPIAVLVADSFQVRDLTGPVPDAAEALMDRFWPGGLTVVLRRRPGLTMRLGADDTTIGVRCPAHPIPRRLAAAVGPLATTSANRHGEPTLSDAAAVDAAFGEELALVLDGGPGGDVPSTVVDCTGEEVRILREGAVSADEVAAALP